ncbi:hypothetical protein CASFOL_031310 [Castilleja foliolosa]|uniref:Copia protein n=1 Tax=Castilleja foliolosa TaxID=1961234 RepID=A0ABD3C509_9LAMI
MEFFPSVSACFLVVILTGNRTSNNCYQINRKVLCKKEAVKELKRINIQTAQAHEKGIEVCALQNLMTPYSPELPPLKFLGPLDVEIVGGKRVKVVEDDDLLNDQNPQFDLSIVLVKDAGSEVKKTGDVTSNVMSPEVTSSPVAPCSEQNVRANEKANSGSESEQDETDDGQFDPHQIDTLARVQELCPINQEIGKIDKILFSCVTYKHFLIVRFHADKMICYSTNEKLIFAFIQRMSNILKMSNKTEAKLVAIAKANTQPLRMNQMIVDLGLHGQILAELCDKSNAFEISSDSVQHSHKKHIDMRYHPIHGLIERRIFNLEHIGTDNMLADICTKTLENETPSQLRGDLVMCTF